jgi:hypothetical protein
MIPMQGDTTVFDYLTTKKISDVSISELNSAAKNSFADTTNIEFWRGVLTVSNILKQSRTYGGGLPIPETSGCERVTVADTGTGSIKPQDSEIWMIQSIDLDNCTAYLFDGATTIPITAELATSNIYLTPTLYLVFNNASGGEQTPGIAYHKVGL